MHRDHALFDRYPDRSVRLPWGSTYRLPFHCYESETLLIGGTVDLEGLTALLAPEDLAPVVLRREGGRPVGAAWLWINDYRDTNAGPYRELVVGFGAAERALELPFVNPVSTLAPMAHPRGRVFARWLFLDVQHPVDLGIDVWGFPKERGEVAIEGDRHTLRHRVCDASGAPVLELAVRRLGDLGHWAVGGLRAALALGARRTLALAAASELPVTVVTPREVKASRVPGFLAGRPVVYRWGEDDRLDLFTESACGGALDRLGYQPWVVQRFDPLHFVMLPDPATLERPPARRP